MSVLKYKNPSYVEGGSQPKWLPVGSSPGSSGGNGDTGGGSDGGSGGGGSDTKQYETVNVSISADNGASITADVTVNGEAKSVTSGSSVPWEVEYGTEYTIEVADVEGYSKPETLTFTAEQSTRNVDFVLNQILITTIQINQTITDPATMITRVVDNGGIEAIRANSHRYVGVYNINKDIMSLKQLDDTDSTKFVDGSVADITTFGNDVFMKLPKFWYKCILRNVDVWEFSVAYGGKPDQTFKEWDGKELIGVYVASFSDGGIYSSSEKTFATQISFDDFKSFCSNRGLGFSLTKWKHHCMITMLFYTYYMNTNSRTICGNGSSISYYTNLTGKSNLMGMSDTTVENGKEVVNIWGIENWYKPLGELLGNTLTTSDNVCHIYEDDGTERIFSTDLADGVPTKWKFGEYLDLWPIKMEGTLESTGFCDRFNVPNIGNTPVACMAKNGNAMSGITGFDAGWNGADTSQNLARLCYRGDYIIEE